MRICLFFLFTLFCCQTFSQKTIHVFVALCDNEHQGIVPVPEQLGNGTDLHGNLYWGAAYGVKTFFSKDTSWKFIRKIPSPEENILERCIFQYRRSDVWLIADAWNGANIKECTMAFLNAVAGNGKKIITEGADTLRCGGDASLLCYTGHDGLMDFTPEMIPVNFSGTQKDVMILACASKIFFSGILTTMHAHPVLWTTGLMCPEAYTLAAAINTWIDDRIDQEIAESAARAYDKYQKCGVRAAERLLVTGY